jgi:hypothetical protein
MVQMAVRAAAQVQEQRLRVATEARQLSVRETTAVLVLCCKVRAALLRVVEPVARD